MKIFWNQTFSAGLGDKLGYSVAQDKLYRALERSGVEIDPGAEVALSFSPPHLFQPVEGKHNILFSMFEMEALPDDFVAGFRKADMIIVPAEHNQKVLAEYGLVVQVCPLGIDLAQYRYRQRGFHGSRNFRFLWLGAPNLRKGYDLAVTAFTEEFRLDEPVELFMKTTSMGDVTQEFNVAGKVIFDSGYYESEALVELYHSAQAFVFPSRGEGFGLTAAEAMATGALLIAPRHTGLEWFVMPATALVVRCQRRLVNFGVDYWCHEPEIAALRAAMRYAYGHYGRTRGIRKAGAKLARRFTWENTARQLIEICSRRLQPAKREAA